MWCPAGSRSHPNEDTACRVPTLQCCVLSIGKIMKQYLSALLIVLASASALSQESTDWTAINLAVTDAHVLPAYENFSTASAGLAPAAGALCANPNEATFAAMQQAFHTSMDGWQAVQHIQFGPVTYFNWNFRLQYWPDEKNTGARQLDVLIAGQDEAQLQAETFARLSVGVQGYPALERLLFENDSLQLLEQDPYRCKVVETIAANIGGIAAETSARWVDEFRDTIATADDRGFFESEQDATVEFYKALVETLQRHQQQKVQPVLGEDFDASRERRAESWRSARSLRNLKLNIAALQDLFDGSEPPLSAALVPEDVDAIREDFAALQTLVAALPDAYAPALEDESAYQQLVQFESAMDALYEQLEAALKNTDLYLGFNSLDGD